MKTLYLTKGLPASGKTTAAKALVVTQPGTKRVNKDDLRAMIDGGKWSQINENFIIGARNELTRAALTEGYHVIVDDTNLAPKHEVWARDMAKFHKAKFEILDYTHVTPEECIKRDLARPNSIGSKVIMDMYDLYLKPPAMLPPAYMSDKNDCVVIDIDGTVAELYARGPYEWDKVSRDLPRTAVIQTLIGLITTFQLVPVFVSGRDEVCRHETFIWLKKQFNQFQDFDYAPLLFMRPTGDMRRDSIVKREIYETEIKDAWNIKMIFDDRPQVIRECWQVLGFGGRVFNVGTGKEF